MGFLRALLVLTTLAGPAENADTSPPRPRFLTVPEMMRRMEASPVHYSILSTYEEPVEQLEEKLWPRTIRPVLMPRVVEDGPGRKVIPWQIPEEVRALSDEAEDLYGKGLFREAAERYRRILEIAPDHYLVRAALGDCALFTKDPKAALEHFDAAIQINPDDHRVHYYRANALMALGQKAEAIDSFTTSLVLNPRNRVLLDHLRRYAKYLGIEVRSDLMVPRAYVQKEGETVTLYFDKENPHWLTWAVCKGLWLGDPSHRQEMTGRADRSWTTIEEMECLAALATSYLTALKDGKSQPDPELDTLVNVLRDGLASSFVIYELGSRVDPQITLKVEKRHRDFVHRYVRKYVLGVPDRG